MLDRTGALLIATCAASSGVLVALVASGRGQLLSLAFYVIALCAIVTFVWRLSVTERKPTTPASLNRHDVLAIAALTGLQVAALIYMSTYRDHYVQDEFITGFTSYTLGPFAEINWFAGYPEPGAWIAQFPILYFVLQWPFIELLGLSLETIRVSTWPYHLLSVALVYLIGREFLPGRIWPAIGSLCFILLAPNLYMAGYGMHNISSTFFFLAALYSAVQVSNRPERIWPIACGLFTVAAYLTYISSYLTIPIIGLFVLSLAIQQRSPAPLRRMFPVLAIVVVGLLPFVVHAVTQENYFLQRGDQVNAIGQFFGDAPLEADDDSPAEQLFDHLATNFRSLYSPGIGGVTDYWFGRQALFDWMTLALIVAGTGGALVQGIRTSNPLLLVVVATVLATFFFGMFLTLPAGGFHRTSLAFPTIGLLIAYSVFLAWKGVRSLTPRRRVQRAVPSAVVAAFLALNIVSLQTMVREDRDISSLVDSVTITEYIEAHVPAGEEVLIVAFPNYHLEREIIVRTGDAYPVEIVTFDDALARADSAPIILWRPNESQRKALREAQPDGRFLDSIYGTELRFHTLYMPPRAEDDRARTDPHLTDAIASRFAPRFPNDAR